MLLPDDAVVGVKYKRGKYRIWYVCGKFNVS